jgi:hypothetical protein
MQSAAASGKARSEESGEILRIESYESIANPHVCDAKILVVASVDG